MLDPRRLLTFREVARQRSFSLAARELALTQPAVSQQIRALEVQLGERLIERGRGGFALTHAGELLLSHADAVAERLRLAEAQLGETLTEAQRKLRVGAFPSMLATRVPTAIAWLHEHVEGLEVSVVQGSTDDLVAGVRGGTLHVAVCFQDGGNPRREHEGVRRVDLFDQPMVVLLGPGHRLARRKRVRLDELAADVWIAATPDGLIYNACVGAGFEPQLAYLTGDPLAIRALVAADLAVTLTGRLLAEHLDGVVVVDIAGTPPRQGIYAVLPPAGAHRLVTPFLDALSPA